MAVTEDTKPNAVEQWLAKRERDELAALHQAEQALTEAEQQVEAQRLQVDSQRVKLGLIRQLRADALRTVDADERPASESAAVSTEPADVESRDDRPAFTEVTDPTGRRAAIWDVLHARRGQELDNAAIHGALIERGAIPPGTPIKDISVTTRRMSEAGQIEKAGWGKYGLGLEPESSLQLVDSREEAP